MVNYYDILGVNFHASKEEIKQAYRQMAKMHHPDVGGDPNFFKQGQKAYTVLIDNQLRKQYDAYFSATVVEQHKKKAHEWQEMKWKKEYAPKYSSSYTHSKERANIQRINQRNVLSNIVNGGFVASDGHWLYYSGKQGLYKMREDGTQLEKLFHSEVRYLNVYGSDLYFGSSAGVFQLNSVNKNQTQRLMSREVRNLLVYKGYLYFLLPNQWGIYRSDLNGKNGCVITHDEALHMAIQDGWIYYTKRADGNSRLYKIKVNGTDKQLMIKNGVGTFSINGDSIYFLNLSSWFGNVCKIRINGVGNIYPVQNVYPEHLIVSDNKILYINGRVGSKDMGRLSISELEKLHEAKVASPDKNELRGINFVGNWIYYHDIGGLYRIHIKSYEKEKVD